MKRGEKGKKALDLKQTNLYGRLYLPSRFFPPKVTSRSFCKSNVCVLSIMYCYSFRNLLLYPLFFSFIFDNDLGACINLKKSTRFSSRVNKSYISKMFPHTCPYTVKHAHHFILYGFSSFALLNPLHFIQQKSIS